MGKMDKTDRLFLLVFMAAVGIIFSAFDIKEYAKSMNDSWLAFLNMGISLGAFVGAAILAKRPWQKIILLSLMTISGFAHCGLSLLKAVSVLRDSASVLFYLSGILIMGIIMLLGWLMAYTEISEPAVENNNLLGNE
ncbi:hypothetical protein IPM19_04030 [bacterium]|nr:MAG: hypothetical protein IPM19_04030 [bacterium]